MAAVIQRPLRGSRISTFYPVKNLPSLSSLDSAFQLQEYISLLIRLDVHDVEAIVSLPGSPKDSGHDKEDTSKEADKESKNEVTVDEACWIYEQLRRLAQDLSHPLITTLQQECTRASCPEMKAGEWLYLCVAHGNDGAMEQCCAIDYILHTVDSATALLNSPRTFPSRLQIPQTSYRHFSSLARRLGRIFAHAYFHHREAFEQAEAESSLYARFLALTAKFDLVPAEFLVIPSSQFSGEDSGSDSDREQSNRAYNDGRQNYPPQHIREEDYQRHQQDLSQSQQQQQQRDVSPGAEGSAGESPLSATRSRMGRTRTDTMVFTDAEASAVTDELAAKAKAGELEPDDEHEAPSTARPVIGEKLVEEEPEVEQFEILMKPEVARAVIEETNPPPVVPESTPAPEAEIPVEEVSEKDVAEGSTHPVPNEETPPSQPESVPPPAPDFEEMPTSSLLPTSEAPHEPLPEVKEIDFAVQHPHPPVEPPTAEVESNSVDTSAVVLEPSESEPLPEPEVSAVPSMLSLETAAPIASPVPVSSTEEISAEVAEEAKEEAKEEDIPAPPDPVPAVAESSAIAPVEIELVEQEVIPAPLEDEVKPLTLEDEAKPTTPEDEAKPPPTEDEVAPPTSEEPEKPPAPDTTSAEPPVTEQPPSEAAQAAPEGA
ncbi:Mob1/phocein [Pholiota molesta]|nr:Mob1/phocein [Pholiota molesta]